MIKRAMQTTTFLLNRMPLAWMLSALLVLGLIPALVLGGLFVNQSLKDIRFARSEVAGLQYLGALWPVYTLTTDPRDQSVIQLRARAVVPDFINRLRQSNNMFDSATEERALLTQLKRMQYAGERGSNEAAGALMTRVGDTSNLILDPDLDTYYLMDIVLLKLRDLSDKVGAAKTVQTPEQAQIARAALIESAKAVSASVTLALRGNVDGTLLPSNLLAQSRTLEKAVGLYATALTNNPSVVPQPDAVERARDQMWSLSARQLDRLLKARIERFELRLKISLLMSAAVAAVVFILGMLLVRSISANLGAITLRLSALSAGDHESPVPATALQNDIGIIARALGEFVTLSAEVSRRENENRRLLEQTVASVRQENTALMHQRSEQQQQSQDAERRAVVALADSLEAQISDVLSAAHNAAANMNEAAGSMADMSARTQDHSGKATDAADKIRDAVDEAAPRVVEVAERLRALSIKSDEGRALAEAAIKRVDMATERMVAFADATDRIDAMQATIATVASQTNMLALNAAIEATRVGAAGQGFMVVANEVKALSDSTRSATQDISDQIANMRTANGSVLDAFDAIVASMNRVAESARNISDNITAQTETISVVENAMTVAQATVLDMTHDVARTDSAARTAFGTSTDIARNCTNVVDQLSTLDSTIDRFTTGVKQAQASR